jgi:hypothetical protein
MGSRGAPGGRGSCTRGANASRAPHGARRTTARSVQRSPSRGLVLGASPGCVPARARQRALAQPSAPVRGRGGSRARPRHVHASDRCPCAKDGHRARAVRADPRRAGRRGAGQGPSPRTVHLLNPCRARLCRDPLEWLWTTARDMVGAVVDPWVRLEGLVDAVGPGPRISLAGFHRFVSSDPCVAVQGTPLPRPVVSSGCPARPLHHIVQAAAVATRAPASAIAQHGDTRQLLVALARDQGWRGSADLGELVSLSARSVARLVASCDPAFVEAGRMCLGDDRLLYPRPHDAAGLREPHDPHALSALHASGW